MNLKKKTKKKTIMLYLPNKYMIATTIEIKALNN